MNIERMKFPRLLLWSLLKMQRKYGGVTGTIYWFAACWFISVVIIITVVSLI